MVLCGQAKVLVALVFPCKYLFTVIFWNVCWTLDSSRGRYSHLSVMLWNDTFWSLLVALFTVKRSRPLHEQVDQMTWTQTNASALMRLGLCAERTHSGVRSRRRYRSTTTNHPWAAPKATRSQHHHPESPETNLAMWRPQLLHSEQGHYMH